jgi:hypothetical protein
VAEGTRLLSEYGGQTPSRVRIPPSPLSLKPLEHGVSGENCGPRPSVSEAALGAVWKRFGSDEVVFRAVLMAWNVRSSREPDSGLALPAFLAPNDEDRPIGRST